MFIIIEKNDHAYEAIAFIDRFSYDHHGDGELGRFKSPSLQAAYDMAAQLGLIEARRLSELTSGAEFEAQGPDGSQLIQHCIDYLSGV
jgi:hypothetical protein